MATAAAPAVRSQRSYTKYALFALFFVTLVITWVTRDFMLLDAKSFLRQRYAAIPALMFLHGIPGVLALALGILQFSSRLRQRFLQLHRVLGRIYVGCVVVSAPVAVIVSIKLPIPTLTPASIIQASGWLLCTATAIYCVKTGKIQQHREWMTRGYAFAAVFVVVRAVDAIPSLAQQGLGAIPVIVWTTIATACFLPSFAIEWQKLYSAHRTAARARNIIAARASRS